MKIIIENLKTQSLSFVRKLFSIVKNPTFLGYTISIVLHYSSYVFISQMKSNEELESTDSFVNFEIISTGTGPSRGNFSTEPQKIVEEKESTAVKEKTPSEGISLEEEEESKEEVEKTPTVQEQKIENFPTRTTGQGRGDGRGSSINPGSREGGSQTGRNPRRDLSSDAILIRSSIQKPKYTDEALDAELEGVVIVNVFVNKKGYVEDVALDKKIGYGMDKVLVESAKQARFIPRKNARGQALTGWTEIRFILTVE